MFKLRQVVIFAFLSMIWRPMMGTLRIRREQLDRFCLYMEEFCETKDYFENPLKAELFCSIRNARCSGTDCKECTCQVGFENFISYTYGCMSFEASKKLLTGDTNVFPPSMEPWYSGAIESTGVIPYLNMMLDPSFAYKYIRGVCNVDQMELIDEGTSQLVMKPNRNRMMIVSKNPGTDGKYYYRVKCNRFDGHDLDICKESFKGKVGSVQITCTSYGTDKTITKMAVLGKGDGNTILNVPTDIPTVTKPAPVSNGSSDYISVNSLETSLDFSFKDIFQNTYTRDKEGFCGQFNGHCALNVTSLTTGNGTECNFCQCPDDTIFVSFKHGCQSESKIKELFKITGKTTTDSSLEINNKTFSANEVPQFNTDLFMFGTCIAINIDPGCSYQEGLSSLSKLKENEHEEKPFFRTANRTCNITKVSSVNIVEGQLLDGEDGFEQPFELMSLSTIGKDSYCLKCKNFTCDLTPFSSLVMQIEITCTGKIQNNKDERRNESFEDVVEYGEGHSSSIVFKFTGESYVNASAYADIFEEKEVVVPTTASTFAPFTKQQNHASSGRSSSSFKSTTVIGILSSLVVVLIVMIALLVHTRKRYLRKKRTKCGHHYISDERDEEEDMNFVQLKGKSKGNKYSEVAILQQRNTDQDTTLKGKENLYYEASSMGDVKVNSLYTENEISQAGYLQNENDMYGVEYGTLHGANSTLESQNNMYSTATNLLNPKSEAELNFGLPPQSQVSGHLYAGVTDQTIFPSPGNLCATTDTQQAGYAVVDKQLSPQFSNASIPSSQHPQTEHLYASTDKPLTPQYQNKNMISPQVPTYNLYEETEPEDPHLYGTVSDLNTGYQPPGKITNTGNSDYDTPKMLRMSQLKDIKPINNQSHDRETGNLYYGKGQNIKEPYYGNMDSVNQKDSEYAYASDKRC
ncbi:uncharacterized protein [Clytia hemisphaerica]|uniref:Uncharacterized protein n=1 Tax=Clytia hemisphaerica TaxID=252671 RepID=A0A7M5WSQ7_9CNID